MGRAFTDGVSQEKKVRMRVKRRSWKPLADLQGLSGRTKSTGNEMGPLVDVPAMVRIAVSYTHLTLPTICSV